MAEPPIIPIQEPVKPGGTLGRLGLLFSFAGLCALALMWLVQPG